jgi:hypothetical protein
MLRSQYERVDREDMVPRFGAKAYRPDFGIPDLQTQVEVKFIGEQSDLAAIQEEILADVPGYLNEATKFGASWSWSMTTRLRRTGIPPASPR